MKKDISVIIVNWNTKDLLLQCIISIMENTHSLDIEIIVVDNASTDGSQDALKKEFPEVILIQNDDNLGFAKANNIGMESSSGKYLCLVNSDVVVKDNCIDNLFDYLESHKDVGIAGPKSFFPNGDLQHTFKRFPTIWRSFCEAFFLHLIFPGIPFFAAANRSFINTNTISKVDTLAGAFWFVRRESMEKVGMLDEDFFFYGEDVDWCKRFSNFGYVVLFFPGSEIIHFAGMSSTDRPVKYYIQLCRAKLQYGKKHFSPFAFFFLRLISLFKEFNRSVLYAFLNLFSFFQKPGHLNKFKQSTSCLLWLLKTPSNELSQSKNI